MSFCKKDLQKFELDCANMDYYELHKIYINNSSLQKYFEYYQLSNREDDKIYYIKGVCYLHGFGTKRDINSAEYWLTKSAECNNADAQYKLGIFCNNVKEDYINDMVWLKRAAEQNHSKAILAVNFLSQSR